jgi:hypothetical protein
VEEARLDLIILGVAYDNGSRAKFCRDVSEKAIPRVACGGLRTISGRVVTTSTRRASDRCLDL